MSGREVENDGSITLQPSTGMSNDVNPSKDVPPKVLVHSRHGDWKVPLFFFGLGSLFALFAIANSIRQPLQNKDYAQWFNIGRSVLAGKPLYEEKMGDEPAFMYPPTSAVLFFMPLSILGSVTFVAVLSLLNAASWAFSVWAATELAGGRSIRRSFGYSILPGLFVTPYVWDIQLLGQLNLILLAMTLGAFLSLRKRHSILASGLFGMAVCIKVFPLPAIAYFFVRREWTAVVASIISIFAFLWFFPGLIRGFERNTNELQQWASMMIADQSGQTMAGRSSIGFTRRNQSLVSCSHRLLRKIDGGEDGAHPVYVNFADVSPKTAQLVGYGACLVLGLVLLLACRFRFGLTLECEGLEVAMVCTLVPLCSPLAWTYFFCWLLPAWVTIVFWLDSPILTPQGRRGLIIGTSIGGLLLLSAVSEQFDATLQAYGVTAFGAVALFLTLAYVRFQLPNPSISDVSVSPQS